MSNGIKKLQEEYKSIKKKGILAQIGGSARPINKTNFLHWCACFIGPKDTPYEDGYYFLEMKFDKNYPNTGPEDVQMRTPIYHPNISNNKGHICVSYINDWEPTNDVAGIVMAVFNLLSDPNPLDGYFNKIDLEKAKEINIKFANADQKIDWTNSWNNGWSKIK